MTANHRLPAEKMVIAPSDSIRSLLLIANILLFVIMVFTVAIFLWLATGQ